MYNVGFKVQVLGFVPSKTRILLVTVTLHSHVVFSTETIGFR